MNYGESEANLTTYLAGRGRGRGEGGGESRGEGEGGGILPTAQEKTPGVLKG